MSTPANFDGAKPIIDPANAAMLHKRWALHNESGPQCEPSQESVSPAVPGRASDKPDFLRKLP